MKITGLVVLYSLSVISEGQLLAVARGLYQPILLSMGAAFTAFVTQEDDEDGNGWDKFVSLI